MSKVNQVRSAILCRYCRRELIAYQNRERANARVPILLRCHVHGTLTEGERFYTGYVSEDN